MFEPLFTYLLLLAGSYFYFMICPVINKLNSLKFLFYSI